MAASASSFARDTAYRLNARAFGRRWRDYLQLVAALLVIAAVAVFVPAFVMEQFLLGFGVGGIVMVGALSVGRIDDPQMRGHLAETFSVETLRKIRGWLVIDNLPFDRVDVDHVVVTPHGVLAVESKHHGKLDPNSRAARERASRDLAAASAAARKVRLFLASKGIKDVSVIPTLMVWGAGRPVLPEGSRIVNEVHVADANHPELWAHRFAAPLISEARRREIFGMLRDYVQTRSRYESARTISLRRQLIDEIRTGIAEERTERAARRDLVRASSRRHARGQLLQDESSF